LRLKARFLDDAPALAGGKVPPGARRLAWLSLTTWCLALVFGRLTGYPEIIASWFGGQA
jgi:hypothetical protein